MAGRYGRKGDYLMAITKKTFTKALADVKTCLDAIYCRKEDLGAVTVAVSPSEPDAPKAHWIKPTDLSAGTLQAKKIVISSCRPDDSNAIWINTSNQ